MKIRIFIFLLFTFLILSFIKAPQTLAQSVSLGIYPPVFEMETTPPSDIKVPFFIQNYTNSSVNLKISLKPFTQAPSEDGQVEFLDDTFSYPDPVFLQRVQILYQGNSVDLLTLSPNERKNLILEIQVPPNETKGDYYFSIIFNSLNNFEGSDTSSKASGGIATNVLLSVGPVGKTQGYIQEFSSPLFLNQGPVPFTVRIKNTSDHYITPTGSISITNMYGQNIGEVHLLPVNILSNTIRRIPDSMQSPTASPSASLNSYFKTLDKVYAVWPETFLLGLYTAKLNVSLSSKGPVFTREITFFAFPIEYMIAILIIIGITVFVVLRVKKQLNRNL